MLQHKNSASSKNLFLYIEAVKSNFRNEEGSNWDVFWSDAGNLLTIIILIGISDQMFQQMKLYQKVNHFPGMFMITRK